MKVSLAIFITLVFLTTLVLSKEDTYVSIDKFELIEPTYLDLSSPDSKIIIQKGKLQQKPTLTYAYRITDQNKAYELSAKLLSIGGNIVINAD